MAFKVIFEGFEVSTRNLIVPERKEPHMLTLAFDWPLLPRMIRDSTSSLRLVVMTRFRMLR
jgi:hypothetical protein